MYGCGLPDWTQHGHPDSRVRSHLVDLALCGTLGVGWHGDRVVPGGVNLIEVYNQYW